MKPEDVGPSLKEMKWVVALMLGLLAWLAMFGEPTDWMPK